MRLLQIASIGAVVGIACAPSSRDISPAHAAAMQDSVRYFAVQIARGLASDGPSAWLRYFESHPSFFMASDGQLVFPTNDSARAFVGMLATTVAAIDLEWVELRIEPVAPGLAVLAASYRETITDTAGTTVFFGGFMTGLARHTATGWQLRNLHWSSPAPSSH